jgi:hypothetical protein
MSSKNNDYMAWCKIMDASIRPPFSSQIIAECRQLAAEMNKKRQNVNWDHLNHFDTILNNCREKT